MTEEIIFSLSNNLGVAVFLLGTLGLSPSLKDDAIYLKPKYEEGRLDRFFGLGFSFKLITLAVMLFFIHMIVVSFVKSNIFFYASLYVTGLSIPWITRISLLMPFYALVKIIPKK